MKKSFNMFMFLGKICFSLLFMSLLESCATSNATTTMSNGESFSKYQYVVFGDLGNGDAELSDILLEARNEIGCYFKEVDGNNALDLLQKGKDVLSPQISVKTETRDGGYTYITINFFDYLTNKLVAVIKSKGRGLTIEEDQMFALEALRTELKKMNATK